MGYDVKDIYSKIYIGKCNLRMFVERSHWKTKKREEKNIV